MKATDFTSSRPRLAAVLALLLCWRSVLAGAEPPAAAPGAPTLEAVSQAMSDVRTIVSRFTQERHLSLFREPLRSEGFLCCEKPGRVRWEITRPYRSVLVSDGARVAQFEWMEDRWRKLDLGLADAMRRVVAQIAGVIEGRYAQGGKDFQATLRRDDAGPVITLVPQNERIRKMMAAIEVHLAPDLRGTRRVVLRERDTDYTEIRFEETVVNARLPEGTFDPAQPAALDAIRRALPAQP